MIIVCQKCSSRLQVDETKFSVRPSGIRCPQCHNSMDGGQLSPASEKSALAVGGSPATELPRFHQPTPAPPFQLPASDLEESRGPSDAERVVQLLASIIGRKGGAGLDTLSDSSWDQRKALVCTAQIHRQTIARQLTETGYQVFVAQDTGQAVERMRENQLDVVLLDLQFDPAEQGAAFVLREVNVLRPAQRRRQFLVLLSPVLRTMDAHAAFLNNVNAVVNFNEIADLRGILEHALREYNELYKDFNSALKLRAL